MTNHPILVSTAGGLFYASENSVFAFTCESDKSPGSIVNLSFLNFPHCLASSCTPEDLEAKYTSLRTIFIADFSEAGLQCVYTGS